MTTKSKEPNKSEYMPWGPPIPQVMGVWEDREYVIKMARSVFGNRLNEGIQQLKMMHDSLPESSRKYFHDNTIPELMRAFIECKNFDDPVGTLKFTLECSRRLPEQRRLEFYDVHLIGLIKKSDGNSGYVKHEIQSRSM